MISILKLTRNVSSTLPTFYLCGFVYIIFVTDWGCSPGWCKPVLIQGGQYSLCSVPFGAALELCGARMCDLYHCSTMWIWSLFCCYSWIIKRVGFPFGYPFFKYSLNIYICIFCPSLSLLFLVLLWHDFSSKGFIQIWRSAPEKKNC